MTPNGPRQPLLEDPSEYFLDLIADTLEQLDPAVQGAFLQKFLNGLAGVDVSEDDSLVYWQAIQLRRRELTERLGRPVTLKTAAVDYFGTALLLKNPILLEYHELKRLRQSAATDPLTGLYNRRLFDESLAKELSRSQRYSYPLGLLLLDLRNFKKANDTYGHAIGDEVLLYLAQACTETVRGSDYPCRIGGDEFGLLLPQSDGKSASALARRIAYKFENHVQRLAPDVGLGLDYGVASFPEDGDKASSLFEVADHRLYAYKKEAHRGRRPWQREHDEPRVLSVPAPATSPTVVEGGAAPSSSRQELRRYERISLEGTGAYGILRNGIGPKVARVIDLSLGGASFLLDETIQAPETFYARLHVPILLFPPSDMKMRRVYSRRLAQGLQRIGCHFGA
ncbi:MAG: diguanylate cyclase domain-containing protein [Terriglobia bacterium]